MLGTFESSPSFGYTIILNALLEVTQPHQAEKRWGQIPSPSHALSTKQLYLSLSSSKPWLFSSLPSLCPSPALSKHREIGKVSLEARVSPTTQEIIIFYKHHKIIRVIWLKVKELFIRNNPWIRYTLNLLTSLWSTGIHKLLVANLQKIHSIGPKIQIKSLENKSFFENY